VKKLLITMLALTSLLLLVACTPTPEPPTPGPPCELTAELGQKIVSAGQFWEDWWDLTGPFTIGPFEWDDLPRDTPHGWSFMPLVPDSAFTSLDDIRNYLLQFHTEEWVDTRVFNEYSPFFEYDGRLYAMDIRAGFPRADWGTAQHTLVEHEGNRGYYLGVHTRRRKVTFDKS